MLCHMAIKLEQLLRVAPLMLYLVSMFLKLSSVDCCTRYVRPSSLTHCPKEPCHTLSDYARNIGRYFCPENTTLVFLSGTHHLDTDLNVSGLKVFQLLGNASEPTACKVVCTQPAHMSATHVTHVTVSALTFSHCGSRLSSQDNETSVLDIENVDNFTLDACQLLNSQSDAKGLLLRSVALAHIVSSRFENNTSASSGGGASIYCSRVHFSGCNLFVGNSIALPSGAPVSMARWGGALMSSGSNLTFDGNVTFRNGRASFGGGIYATGCELHFYGGNSHFIANQADDSGGGLYLDSGSSVLNAASVTFQRNNATYGGGAAITARSKLFNDNAGSLIVSNNTATKSGGGLCVNVNSVIDNAGKLILEGNSALLGSRARYGIGGGGLYLSLSLFKSSGLLRAKENTAAGNGGGIYFNIASFIFVFPKTKIFFINNVANQFGGAIYVNDAVSSPLYCTSPDYFFYRYMCFFQLATESSESSAQEVKMTFDGNVAKFGSDLYGGVIDKCNLNNNNSSQNSTEVFDRITDMKQSATISSDAFQIKFCDFEYGLIVEEVFPGEMFSMGVKAMGQRGSPSQGRAQIYVSSNASLGSYNQLRQQVYPNCTPLHLTVLAQEASDVMLTVVTETCVGQQSLYDLNVKLHVKPCPQPLFHFSNKACECAERLNGLDAECNISNQSVLRKGNFWLGFDNATDELIIQPLCPFYYCSEENVSFSLSETDVQCSYNRSGLLCGKCRDGLSLTLGLHMCRECSNTYLLLLVVFVALGLVLLIFLMIFQLTVAHGTINGLVFYANIIQMNRITFLGLGLGQLEQPGRFLLVFIAWFNLNFGFVTCLYDGMNMYVLTWLQYLFPLYILFLVVALVYIKHYPRWVSRVMGTNPVAVLSTLILLSYNKILHTIVTVVSSTELQYMNYTRRVWLYDGTVPFLEGKHLIMFVFAVLVFLFMVLPYTLLLLCGQCILLKSNWRIFCWVNNSKVKAFLDNYHAPYRVKHRYWPGLLLLLRLIVLLSLSCTNSSDASLLAVSMIVIAILTWAWMVGGIYKRRWLNVLEASVMLNLGFLAAASCYCTPHNKYISFASLGVAFLTFVGVMVYHAHLKVRTTGCWKKVLLKVHGAVCCWERDESRSIVNSSEPSLHMSYDRNNRL